MNSAALVPIPSLSFALYLTLSVTSAVMLVMLSDAAPLLHCWSAHAGPQDYAQATSALAGPAFTMQARAASAKFTASTPGPGAYESLRDATLPAAPVLTIGTRPPQRSAAEATPAPGEYHKNDQVESGPAFTIPAASKPPEHRDFVPGPGEYASQPHDHGPAFSVPRAERLAEAASDLDAPGPGAYDTPVPGAGPAFSVPVSGAAEDGDVPASADVPGPGKYEPARTDAGPAYTMGVKISDAHTERHDTVGPGSYEPITLSDGPAYTIQVCSVLRSCHALAAIAR